MSLDKPHPGSDKAVAAGCVCAVMDNHRGKGRGGDGVKYGWYVTGGCPLHDAKEKPVNEQS